MELVKSHYVPENLPIPQERQRAATKGGVRMSVDLKRGKIIFVDDQEDAVSPYVQHLKDEGFTNVVYLPDVKSFNQLLQQAPDLLFLDITGVATSLDAEDEGLTVLEYVKKHRPWTQIIVLSGSEFPASKAKPLSQADLCITKASLNLAELVNVTEDQLTTALSPEYRNVKILDVIAQQLDEISLSWWKKRKIQRLIATAHAHEGDAAFDWNSLVKKTKETLGTASNVASILSLLVS